MIEQFDPKDFSMLFKSADPMHDQIITHIEDNFKEMRIEYGNIGSSGYRPTFTKLTVVYLFDPDNNDYSLSIINKSRLGLHLYEINYSTNDPSVILSLNQWEMEMNKFDMDIFGEMTLHFDIFMGKKMRNVELRFTPVNITYYWEESR